MPDFLDRVDRFQRRNPVAGFPLAVVYKFFDDHGGYLAAIITYYAFLAIFPMLLIASSVLGFLLQGNVQLKNAVLNSALSQFPVVGTQLGRPEGLQGSGPAVVVGALTALYGVVGLGQAAQHAVNTTWAVPRNSRLNPFASRLRSLLLFVVAGLSVLGIAVLSSAVSHAEVFGSTVNTGLQLVFSLVSVSLNALVLTMMMRFATVEHRPFRTILPGGITIALMWQVLQWAGGIYVARVINRTSEMNGVFAVVLGLVALIYIASVMAVLGMQVNVVIAHHLFPRALLTPFIDDVDLTDADRRAYTSYAQAQRHKGFEKVRVTFEEAERAERERQAELDAQEPEPPGDVSLDGARGRRAP
ncbi:MAG: YihY/virulence factor BrkB family protein [Nocardioidaceae bacterium]